MRSPTRRCTTWRCTSRPPSRGSSSRDEVTDDVLATEREIALKQAIEQGKPEHIAEKIVTGKMEKFFEQEVLLEQPFAKDPDKTVAQYLRETGGDGATVASFVSLPARVKAAGSQRA